MTDLSHAKRGAALRTPTDLGAEAPSINRFIKQLGPFSQAGIPALTSLGEAQAAGL